MSRQSTKVVDAAPTWAPFAGWSVLLEDRHSGIGLPDDAPIADLVDAYLAQRRSPTPFAVLPMPSLHITLCDGVNVDTGRGPGARRTAPAADRDPGPFRNEIDDLITAARTELDWRPAGLEVRGHAVVVPVATDGPLDEIELRRDLLLTAIGAVVGNPQPPARWRPHVTIGYLVHDGNIAADRDDVARVPDGFVTGTGDTWLTTHRASLYVFHDMATFERSHLPTG